MSTRRLSTIPTAVITESKENTMSSTMICMITAPKVTGLILPVLWDSAPSSFSWISVTAL